MSDATSMLDDLRAMTDSETGRMRLKIAFAVHGVTTRKWSELTPAEVANVWAEVHPTEPDAGGFTPDDSPEGAALNQSIPF